MTILAYLSSINSDSVEEIIQNLFVDGILVLNDAKEEAVNKYSETESMLIKSGINVRELVANSTQSERVIELYRVQRQVEI